MEIASRHLLAFAAVTLIFAGGASAQPETGSLVNQQRGRVNYMDNPNSSNAAQVLQTFARCFARQRERATEAIVQLPYMSQEQETQLRRILSTYEDCLGDNEVSLRFPTQLLVGGMAEHFIVRRYGRVDISSLAPMSDEAVAASAFAGRNAYETLSLCVIRRDPAAARALIATGPRTPDEQAAFSRIIPNLAPCVPADFQMTFSRSALRALIATGIYRVLAALPAG